MNCLLCHSIVFSFKDIAYQCQNCRLLFKNPNRHLSVEEDLKRYSAHQNNSEDLGYIVFLNRLIDPLKNFLPVSFTAIDFGCGPGPTIAKLLSPLGGEVVNYDPLFFSDESLLRQTFDVVTSTEVVEHFKKPMHDWQTLVQLVKPGGLLGIMTQFFTTEINYENWWYKNDPTHIVFYEQKTFEYIANYFSLDKIYDDQKSIVIFRKRK